MEKIFNTLIDSYIENKIGIAEGFLGTALAAHLKDNLNELYSKQAMLSAGTGGQHSKVSQNELVRSDRIYWLDPSHNDQYENAFFVLMDQFVAHLNATCYTGINSYEFHYALYEPGSFYKPHLDRFHHNDSRQFSMIMYLNDNWQLTDGGELRIHQGDSSFTVSPTNGKSVFFKSDELKHEVLLTSKPRMSITGWLKS